MFKNIRDKWIPEIQPFCLKAPFLIVDTKYIDWELEVAPIITASTRFEKDCRDTLLARFPFSSVVALDGSSHSSTKRDGSTWTAVCTVKRKPIEFLRRFAAPINSMEPRLLFTQAILAHLRSIWWEIPNRPLPGT
jgi:hypothetical protein